MNIDEINTKIIELNDKKGIFAKIKNKKEITKLYRLRKEILSNVDFKNLKSTLDNIFLSKDIVLLNKFVNDSKDIYSSTFVGEWNNFNANLKELFFYEHLLETNKNLDSNEKEKIKEKIFQARDDSYLLKEYYNKLVKYLENHLINIGVKTFIECLYNFDEPSHFGLYEVFTKLYNSINLVIFKSIDSNFKEFIYLIILKALLIDISSF